MMYYICSPDTAGKRQLLRSRTAPVKKVIDGKVHWRFDSAPIQTTVDALAKEGVFKLDLPQKGECVYITR